MQSDLKISSRDPGYGKSALVIVTVGTTGEGLPGLIQRVRLDVSPFATRNLSVAVSRMKHIWFGEHAGEQNQRTSIHSLRGLKSAMREPRGSDEREKSFATRPFIRESSRRDAFTRYRMV